MLSFSGVRYAYGGGTALDGLDLAVAAGEFVAVLGANGSGKSTLARHCNGLLVPDEGEVRVKGLNTRSQEDLWEIRRVVGMLFQNPANQIVAASVEEDVAFGPENLGVPPGEIRRRVAQALAHVGLTPFAKHPTHLLSGGQKQRLAVAAVLAMEAECLVLDEPTSMLDPMGRAEVLELLHRLRRERGLTVLLITHFAEEAVTADRLLVLDRGRVAVAGRPAAIFERPELLRRFGLEPPPLADLAFELRRAGLSLAGTPATVEEMVQALCQSST